MENNFRKSKKHVLIVLGFMFCCNTINGQAFENNKNLYQEIEIKCCQLKQGEYIIDNVEEYRKLLDNRSPHPDCSLFELPLIDFEKYILVGYVSSIHGCSFPEISDTLVLINNKYLLTLTIDTNGLCKRNNPIRQWYLINRIDEYTEFEFKIIIQ